MEITINIKSQEHLIKAIIKTISPLYNLTKTEMRIMEHVIRSGGLNTKVRKAMVQDLDIDIYSLNNHINSLKDKTLIVNRNKRNYSYNPNIDLLLKTRELKYKFIDAN